MCGIFGLFASEEICQDSYKRLVRCYERLAILSETRGKDSSGVALLNGSLSKLKVVRGPLPIRSLIKSAAFQKSLQDLANNTGHGFAAYGHSRLVTNGSQLAPENNQPVCSRNMCVIHNGIIVNADDLWGRATGPRRLEIDTEIIPVLLEKHLSRDVPAWKNVNKVLSEVVGTAAFGAHLLHESRFLLASNFKSLYFSGQQGSWLAFASEPSILSAALTSSGLKAVPKIYGLESGECLNLELTSNRWIVEQALSNAASSEKSDATEAKAVNRKLIKTSVEIEEIEGAEAQLSVVASINSMHLRREADSERHLLQYPLEEINSLRRCKVCILPETFPFIEYDRSGCCNFCKAHRTKEPRQALGIDALVLDLESRIKTLDKKRSFDVLVPLSGGRDSIYTLHVVRELLGLRPLTFTYDWGMVTDLARRNIARACGKLEVENVIVAANIHNKRKYIRANVRAWLKKMDLGMIPLFMAGDKFFFFFADKVKKSYGLNAELWGVNRLENTEFKTGFSGLRPSVSKETIFSLSLVDQFKLFRHVALQTLMTPSYINASIFDSLGSFASRYMLPKTDYLEVFDYIKWDESTVTNTIASLYDWEGAVDTSSSWRVGDGTASFYNYIYTLAAGFSENDTFRSNQIREGTLERDQALLLIQKENQPRYNSIKWYLEMIGLDFVETLSRVNQIRRLY